MGVLYSDLWVENICFQEPWHPIEGRGLINLTVYVILMTHRVPSVFFHKSVTTCFYHATGVQAERPCLFVVSCRLAVKTMWMWLNYCWIMEQV